MKRVGVVVHTGKREALEAAERLRSLLAARGLESLPIEEDPNGPFDLVVALGGDGTILRAARYAHESNAPLVGVNLGRIGYLSAVGPDGMEAAMDQILSGGHRLEERLVLEAKASEADAEKAHAIALNELVVERSVPSSVIDVAISVGKEDVATYTADGFIISTPTGSTAYSLSAGGPILEPTMRAMILTPVSAHSPLWRSIVVGPERTVEVRLVRGQAVVSADGAAFCELGPEGVLTISPAHESLKLVSLAERSFFRRIRKRFRIEPEP